MRVIFLDIDGVLNSEAYAATLTKARRSSASVEVQQVVQWLMGDLYTSGDRIHRIAASLDRLVESAEEPALSQIDQGPPLAVDVPVGIDFGLQIDQAAIRRVNRIVAATAASIVISSSWRKRLDLSELRRIFRMHGLLAEIVGVTPDGPKDPEKYVTYEGVDRIFRGHEIDRWLKQHPEVDRFVILDDDSDMVMHKKYLVQTDPEEGLLDQHVDLAISVLRGNVDSDGGGASAEELAIRPPDDGVAPAYALAIRSPYGSSWGIRCHEGACVETLTLSRWTTAPLTHVDDYESLAPALDTAAVLLGWRVFESVWWCPLHVRAKKLLCAGCRESCPECSCVGGPRGVAVEGA